MDLRVAEAGPVLLVLARFAFARLVAVLRRLAAVFFVADRFLRLRGFLLVPVTASAMLVAALDTPSIAASMLVLAVSVIVPRMPRSLSLSMLFTSLRVTRVSVTLSLGRGQWARTKSCVSPREPCRYFWNTRILRPVIWQTQFGG